MTQLANDSMQAVLIWDPVLPRTFADSLQAILMGLCDAYISAFFGMIKQV